MVLNKTTAKIGSGSYSMLGTFTLCVKGRERRGERERETKRKIEEQMNEYIKRHSADCLQID